MQRFFILLTSAITTLVAGEVLFRLLPVSTATMMGYHVDPDIVTYPPGHTWIISTGWDLRNVQRLRANNLGFASEVDYVADPTSIALVGDSFVESSMLDAEVTPSRQLQAALGNTRRVYGFGSPGTGLLDHAQRIRMASERLGVRDFVVWVSVWNVLQSVCGGNTHSRCLDPVSLEPRVERQASAGGLKRVARHSALLQYIFGQLKVDAATLPKALWQRAVPAEPGLKEVARDSHQEGAEQIVGQQRESAIADLVIERFFADIAPYRRGRLIFVLDERRGAGAAGPSLRDQLLQRLDSRGEEVVDLEPLFRQHRSTSPLSLVVGPYDAHLNALGIRLVAGQVASLLQSRPSKAGGTRPSEVVSR